MILAPVSISVQDLMKDAYYGSGATLQPNAMEKRVLTANESRQKCNMKQVWTNCNAKERTNKGHKEIQGEELTEETKAENLQCKMNATQKHAIWHRKSKHANQNKRRHQRTLNERNHYAQKQHKSCIIELRHQATPWNVTLRTNSDRTQSQISWCTTSYKQDLRIPLKAWTKRTKKNWWKD